MSLAVARFMGLYILIVSVAFLLRREEFKEFAYSFAANRELRYIMSFFELAAGLAIVLFLTSWATVHEAIITLIGWLMVAEAVFFLIASGKHVKQLIQLLNNDLYWKVAWKGAGAISTLIGLYLTAAGYGAL